MMKNIIMICDILIKLNVILTDFTFSLLIDNMRSIAVSKNEKITQNVKYVNICYHHIRNFIQNSMIEIFHILSRNIMMNELTKTLNIIKFKKFYNFIELSKKSFNIDKNDNVSSDEDFND